MISKRAELVLNEVFGIKGPEEIPPGIEEGLPPIPLNPYGWPTPGWYSKEHFYSSKDEVSCFLDQVTNAIVIRRQVGDLRQEKRIDRRILAMGNNHNDIIIAECKSLGMNNKDIYKVVNNIRGGRI